MSIQPSQTNQLNMGIQGPSSPASQSSFSEQEDSLLHNMLPPEIISGILRDSGWSVGQQNRLRRVCKLWADPNLSIETTNPGLQVFGPTVWKDYLGLEIEGEIPPPPKNIVEEVKALRESVKGEQEAPECTLVLMPKGLTANKLIELMENPQKGHSTKLKHIFHGIDNEYGDKENRESYWFLMTNDVIEGSRNKSFQEQKDLVKDKTNGKCHLPTYLEALVGCALHNVKNGEHLLNQKDMTFTRCQCLFEGYPIAVGGLGGLFVNSNFPVGHDHDGALALQKFRP